MKVIYDKETDTLTIVLHTGKVAESDELRDGLIVDYDKSGRVVSLELLDASEQISEPQSVEFVLAPAAASPTFVREKPSKRYGS